MSGLDDYQDEIDPSGRIASAIETKEARAPDYAGHSGAQIEAVRAELKATLAEWERAERIRNAAPDLLAALKAAERDQQFAVEWMRREHMIPTAVANAMERLKNTRAAIAKAEGRS